MRTPARRVVFHVGAHKTGTTLLQQCLKAHRRELLRQHGVRYVPRAELAPLIGWGERLVRDPAGLQALLGQEVSERRTKVHTVLASYDNLCGQPFVSGRPGLYPDAPAHLAALREALPDHDTTVLLSVRPQHELIESYYLQTVNIGGSTPFEEWLRPIDLDALSWQPLVTALHDTFGAAAVRLIDFRLVKAGAETFVRHALAAAGVAPDLRLERRWLAHHNPSLSAPGLDLALQLNRRFRDPRERAVVRSYLQRHYSNAVRPERPALLPPGLRDELADRYGAEYETLFGARRREPEPA